VTSFCFYEVRLVFSLNDISYFSAKVIKKQNTSIGKTHKNIGFAFCERKITIFNLLKFLTKKPRLCRKM